MVSGAVQGRLLKMLVSLTAFSFIVIFPFQGTRIQWNHIADFACLILTVFSTFLE